MGKLSNLANLLMPLKAPKKPSAYTSTYNPYLKDSGGWLPTPSYSDHLLDIQSQRQGLTSQQLMQWLFRLDPDVSGAVNAYLTVADTDPVIYVRDLNGEFDEDGHDLVNQIIQALCTRMDYSTGYKYQLSLRALCERMRYMALLRGGIAAELVLDKYARPSQINMVDMGTLLWLEDQPGQYRPKQRTRTTGQIIDLSGVPTFFTSFFRQDPLNIYPDGCFVSAINTIAARQQVINDLYRIMQITGLPRVDVSVVEAALMESAPANVKNDAQAARNYINQRLTDIGVTVGNIRADQPFVHTDTTEVSIINDKNPGMSIDISHVINVLNGQNQAALKVMATVIGRGESGVNTASVEARLFSMNADQLNRPVSDIMSQILTYALRLSGSESIVEFDFLPAELRSESELEPQLALRQARLLMLLSLGLIDDIEFSVQMTGRPPLKGAPKLSGTGFMDPMTTSGAVDAGTAANVSGNGDSLGRSLGGKDGKKAQNMTKSKGVKK